MRTAVYVGHAHARSGTVTHELYKIISVAVEVDKTTGTIVAADINLGSVVSRRYIIRMLVGSAAADMERVIRDVEQNYYSTSQKAVVQAMHDLHKRYMGNVTGVM